MALVRSAGLLLGLLTWTASVEARTAEVKTVARFELEAPAHSPYLLRATVPLPPNTWPRADGRNPFAVKFPGKPGALVAAQIEIVSRYPTGEADVIEVLARGPLDESVRAGARMGATLVFDDALLAADAAAPATIPDVPASVRELLAARTPNSIHLRSRDVYGNLYAVELSDAPDALGFGSAKTLKNGAFVRERRLYGTLVPVPGQQREGPPLPHLMGIHAYVREVAGEEWVGLDLRVNNGAIAGSRTKDAKEEVLGTVYWRSLELVLPKNWTAVSEVKDPFLGEAYEEGSHRIVPLVKPYASGALHMMGPQAQFERRIVLVPLGGEKRARFELDACGLAFVGRGDNLWSWTNGATARYFPQRDRLASIDFLRDGDRGGTAAARAILGRSLRDYRRALETGKPSGYYVVANVMGWAHPWFVPEQGGVGGEGIAVTEGHYVAGAASNDGYLALGLVHRMNVSRQPEALYDARGEIVGYHAWLGADGKIPFDYRTHGRVVVPAFALPMKGGPPASAQVRAVVQRGLRPPYDLGNPFEKEGDVPYSNEALLHWWPHDDQHLVRYTKNTKALVWLGNDSMSKDDLRLSAELFRLFLHESEHVPVEWSSGLTLRAWEAVVRQFPHQGLPLGREHAWGLDAMCAAYSTADDEWRARQRPWFTRFARVLLAASQPSGLIQRTLNEGLLDPTKYCAAQCFECLFLLHAFRCMNESVFRGIDDPLRVELERLGLRAVEYLFFGPPWQRQVADWQPDPAHPTIFFQGPRQAIAISKNDERTTPPFSDAAHWGENYLPKDGLAGGIEIFHVWNALSWAHDVSEGARGSGKDNRYLKRMLQCWTPHASFRDLVRDLHAQANDPAGIDAADWIGVLGKLQELGVR